WRQSFPVAPRVIFVLSAQSTQDRSLTEWLSVAKDLEYSRLYIALPNDTTILCPVIHWDHVTHTRIQSSWIHQENAPLTKGDSPA
ncbi:MAG: hypothetical protein ACYCOU_26245, partial [Sulfobacillus sp.]